MKIAVIADNGCLPRFARDGLDLIEGVEEVTVFSCTNTQHRRRPVRHGAYYALNFFTVRNRLTRFIPIEGGRKRIAESVKFASGWDGAWQVLPDEIIDRMSEFDVILKFGMGLLRVPVAERLPAPILSYHHGDPDHFRGRPAGFWEMVEGAVLMGQMVQVIGNRLDAGRVVAFAETKVMPWSYRATLIESYRHSPLILNQAVRNALADRSLGKPCKGRNYRLPSNWRVIRFVAGMAWQFAARLLYGGFFEKSWRVSTARLADSTAISLGRARPFPSPDLWRTLTVPKPYTFYADPFFSRDPPGILVEALNGKSGLGEIVLVEGGKHERVSSSGGHMSYPATIAVRGRELIIPEIVNWSVPVAFTLAGGQLHRLAELKVEDGLRVVDPTLIERDGHLYLFGTLPEAGSSVLHLWSASSLDDRFERHPASPICLSPKGARMGGALIDADGRLIRLGQDFSRSYGDGLIIFEIETLNPNDYRERAVGRWAFTDRKGPHTLNVSDRDVVFDWYVERFSPLAGLRRLSAHLRSRAAVSGTHTHQ